MLTVDIEKKLTSYTLKVNLAVQEEVLGMLGASGSGKSMTLKCIAGIERPDRGHIELDGTVLFDSDRGIDLPPQKRRIGCLFQQYALFPNMTVSKNIACGVRRQDKAVVIRRVAELIKMMHLEGLENKYPSQISGGEQQRTALARILANDPGVLLLDEPFSALDAHLRFRLEQDLRDTLRNFHRPVVLVSHDRDEVYRLADRIAVLHSGTIETCGSRHEVFNNPQTLNAARLTGCKNISAFSFVSASSQTKSPQIFAADWGIWLYAAKEPEPQGFVGIRMHDLQLMDPDNQKDPAQGKTGSDNCFLCDVTDETENPFSYTIMIHPRKAGPGSTPIAIELEKKRWQRSRSETIIVHFPPEKLLLLKS